MENMCDDEMSIQEIEIPPLPPLMEPNYEVFMKWAQPTTLWDEFVVNRIKMATIR